MAKGQVCARDKQKELRADEKYRIKKNEEAKAYYQEHRAEISRKKKEVYDRRMATLYGCQTRNDDGCHTDKQYAGDIRA